MLRINTLFLITGLFLASQVHAADISMSLAPNAQKDLSNHSVTTLHATCTIHASSSKKTITIQGVRSTSQVNGKDLTPGKSTTLTVYEEKTVDVTAAPGAQVTIKNLSNETLQADCSA